MHEGEPYGHFVVEGVAPDVTGLAALVSRPVAEVKKALAELEDRRVFSRTDAGVIYSRRMVRDKAKADRDRENGKGGGNPKIINGVNPPVKPEPIPPDKAQKPEATYQEVAAADDASVRDQPKAKSAITPEAYEFWGELREILRLSPDDMRCVGAPYSVQAWLTKGLKRPIIKHVFEVVMARRRDAPRTLRYFEEPIMLAHAEADRPLPTVKPEPEVIHVRPSEIRPQSDWKRRQDDGRRALDELRAGLERLDGGGGEGDGADILVLRDSGDGGPEGVPGGGSGGPGAVSGRRYG
jgi:hypothetical protein